VAKRLFKEREKRISFLRRHLSFFNAHPYFASYALGAISRVEEDTPNNPELVERFKNALIGPLGAIGDQLFWGTIKPGCILLAMIGVFLIENVNYLLGYFFIMLVLYNIPHILIRMTGLRTGYREGFDVYKLLNAAQFQRYRNLYRILGAISLGFIIGFSIPQYGTINPMLPVVFGASVVGSYIFHKWKHSFYRNTIIILTCSVLIGILVENI